MKKSINTFVTTLKIWCQIFVIGYFLYRITFKRFMKFNITTSFSESFSLENLILSEILTIMFIFLILTTLLTLRQEKNEMFKSNIYLRLTKIKINKLLNSYFYQPLTYCDQLIENWLKTRFNILRNDYCNNFLCHIYNHTIKAHQNNKINCYLIFYIFFKYIIKFIGVGLFLIDIFYFNKIHYFYFYMPFLILPLLLRYLKFICFKDYSLIVDKLDKYLCINNVLIQDNPNNDNDFPVMLIAMPDYLKAILYYHLAGKENPFLEDIGLSLYYIEEHFEKEKTSFSTKKMAYEYYTKALLNLEKTHIVFYLFKENDLHYENKLNLCLYICYLIGWSFITINMLCNIFPEYFIFNYNMTDPFSGTTLESSMLVYFMTTLRIQKPYKMLRSFLYDKLLFLNFKIRLCLIRLVFNPISRFIFFTLLLILARIFIFTPILLCDGKGPLNFLAGILLSEPDSTSPNENEKDQGTVKYPTAITSISDTLVSTSNPTLDHTPIPDKFNRDINGSKVFNPDPIIFEEGMDSGACTAVIAVAVDAAVNAALTGPQDFNATDSSSNTSDSSNISHSDSESNVSNSNSNASGSDSGSNASDSTTTTSALSHEILDTYYRTPFQYKLTGQYDRDVARRAICGSLFFHPNTLLFKEGLDSGCITGVIVTDEHQIKLHNLVPHTYETAIKAIPCQEHYAIIQPKQGVSQVASEISIDHKLIDLNYQDLFKKYCDAIAPCSSKQETTKVAMEFLKDNLPIEIWCKTTKEFILTDHPHRRFTDAFIEKVIIENDAFELLACHFRSAVTTYNIGLIKNTLHDLAATEAELYKSFDIMQREIFGEALQANPVNPMSPTDLVIAQTLPTPQISMEISLDQQISEFNYQDMFNRYCNEVFKWDANEDATNAAMNFLRDNIPARFWNKDMSEFRLEDNNLHKFVNTFTDKLDFEEDSMKLLSCHFKAAAVTYNTGFLSDSLSDLNNTTLRLNKYFEQLRLRQFVETPKSYPIDPMPPKDLVAPHASAFPMNPIARQSDPILPLDLIPSIAQQCLPTSTTDFMSPCASTPHLNPIAHQSNPVSPIDLIDTKKSTLPVSPEIVKSTIINVDPSKVVMTDFNTF